jgi:hypothetical protein
LPAATKFSDFVISMDSTYLPAGTAIVDPSAALLTICERHPMPGTTSIEFEPVTGSGNGAKSKGGREIFNSALGKVSAM